MRVGWTGNVAGVVKTRSGIEFCLEMKTDTSKVEKYTRMCYELIEVSCKCRGWIERHSGVRKL